MDYTIIFEFLKGLAPWVGYVLTVLGALVVIGTGIDASIPDEKDHGFMTKIFAIPFLGGFLKAVAQFSPFNVKPKA